jgi:trehalose synthase
MEQNAPDLVQLIRPGDVVILHDPQTAGLTAPLKRAGAMVIWRCHVGAEHSNDYVRSAWRFLEPRLASVDVSVFTRSVFVPPEINGMHIRIIPPSIDALSPKNQEMDATTVRAILAHVGLPLNHLPPEAERTFVRQDGSRAQVERTCEILSEALPSDSDTPLIVQVSRWDRLKDPVGVMRGFATHASNGTGAELILAGPKPNGVCDDPEGAQVLAETKAAWGELPPDERRRVHILCLPMDDLEENGAIVNALQRQASVVVQKSIEEGFGLTVAEAMWKSKPVVASAVGGIKEQIEDGVSGVLLEDPRDLEALGETTQRLLKSPDLARSIGERAHERVRERFLHNSQLLRHVELFANLLT